MGGFDPTQGDELARRAAAGDPLATRVLIEMLWPFWLGLVRRSRTMGSLAQQDDHVHNVVAELVAKVGRPHGRGLRLYPAWRDNYPDKNFADWIRIVTANVVRDYVRAERRTARSLACGNEQPSVKRLLNEFANSPALARLGTRPPMTAAQTVRELLDFARTHMDDRAYRALCLWLEGASFEEMARSLALESPREARSQLRAAVAVLRRKFAPEQQIRNRA